MVLEERLVEQAAAGPCSDCGLFVERRAEAIDGFTHSTVQLCAACWNAYQQRQVFAGGCCGSRHDRVSSSNRPVNALQSRSRPRSSVG